MATSIKIGQVHNCYFEILFLFTELVWEGKCSPKLINFFGKHSERRNEFRLHEMSLA